MKHHRTSSQPLSWTDDRIERVRSFVANYGSLLSHREIADTLGITYYSLCHAHFVYDLGLRSADTPHLTDKFEVFRTFFPGWNGTVRGYADYLGINLTTATRWKNRYGIKRVKVQKVKRTRKARTKREYVNNVWTVDKLEKARELSRSLGYFRYGPVISRELGVSRKSVYHANERYGIWSI